jgi:hypothetical protein
MGRHAGDRVRANDPFMTIIVLALLALLAATCLLAGL